MARALAISRIALADVEAGEQERGIELVASIDDALQRARSLIALADECDEAGRGDVLARAREAIEHVDDWHAASWTLLALARACANGGQEEGEVQSIRSLMIAPTSAWSWRCTTTAIRRPPAPRPRPRTISRCDQEIHAHLLRRARRLGRVVRPERRRRHRSGGPGAVARVVPDRAGRIVG